MTSRNRRGGLVGLVGSTLLGVAGLNLQGCNDAQVMGTILAPLGGANDTQGARVLGGLGSAMLSAGNANASRSEVNVYGNGYQPAPAPQVTQNKSGPYWSGRPEFGWVDDVDVMAGLGGVRGQLYFYQGGLQFIGEKGPGQYWMSIPWRQIDESRINSKEGTFGMFVMGRPTIEVTCWNNKTYAFHFMEKRRSEREEARDRMHQALRIIKERVD